MLKPQDGKKRKSSSSVDLREMDKLHVSMVKKLEEADEMDMPGRKTSVSTSCQTEKISRKVSHSAHMTLSNGQDLTPVTRTVRTTVGQKVVSQSGEQILKDCNNTLLNFIDKARILAA